MITLGEISDAFGRPAAPSDRVRPDMQTFITYESEDVCIQARSRRYVVVSARGLSALHSLKHYEYYIDIERRHQKLDSALNSTKINSRRVARPVSLLSINLHIDVTNENTKSYGKSYGYHKRRAARDAPAENKKINRGARLSRKKVKTL
ncbi:unnamed protein product, partial [Brenthis ino]